MIPTCPRQNTRSPRTSGATSGERRPDQRRLHVGIARRLPAAGDQRQLHQPRAVDAADAAPGPEIGHADEPLGLRHEVPGEAAPDAAAAR